MPQKPLPEWQRPIISNRDEVAFFAGKCFMLEELHRTDIPQFELELILDSMFEQSERILGEQ